MAVRHVEHAARLVELREWHALVAPRMAGLAGMGPGFDFAAYARWCDVGVLLAAIRERDDQVAALTKAPTATMPVPGGPCDEHYRKGWNDHARAAVPLVRTAFNRARLAGKDSLTQEALVVEALATSRRAPPPAGPGDTTQVDVWEGSG